MDRGHDTTNRKEFNRQQENNYIVNHALDEILLRENNKVSAEAEAHENIEAKLDYNNLYQIDNMSLDETKQDTAWHKCEFESKLENNYEVENQNGMNFIHGNKVKNYPNEIYCMI